MNDLLPIAEGVAAILKQRKETIAIAESSSGGLIAASMLSIAGASAYFLGGAVIYTRTGFLQYVSEQAFTNTHGLQEDTALALARAIRDKWQSTWGVAEIGAAGPAGNRYGDPPGTSCIAVVGSAKRSATIRTGSDNRVANMRAFASEALKLLTNLLEPK
jgi:nicotinamide-nucleotide amidase